MKYCEDCKHYRPRERFLSSMDSDYAKKFAKCERTNIGVSRDTSDHMEYCSVERGNSMNCGPEAKHFEVKQ